MCLSQGHILRSGILKSQEPVDCNFNDISVDENTLQMSKLFCPTRCTFYHPLLSCLSFLLTHWLSPDSLIRSTSGFVLFFVQKHLLKLEAMLFSCRGNERFLMFFIAHREPCQTRMLVPVEKKHGRRCMAFSIKRLSEIQDINQEINLCNYQRRFSVTHHLRCRYSQFARSVTQVLYRNTDES